MIADDDLTYSPPQAAELLAKSILGSLWSWVGPERLQAAIDEEWTFAAGYQEWAQGATIEDWMTPEEAAAFYAPGVTKALSLAIRSGAIEACCRPRRVGERRPMDKGAWLTDDFRPLRFQQGGFFDPDDYSRLGADLPFRVELAGADVLRHAGAIMRWSNALPTYEGQALPMGIGEDLRPLLGGVFRCGAPVWLLSNGIGLLPLPPELPLPSQGLPEAANDSALLVLAETAMARAPQALPSTARGPRRGPGLDKVRWASFYMAVIDLAKAGRLNRANFETQASLREELLMTMGDDPFNEDYIKDDVAQLHRRYCSDD